METSLIVSFMLFTAALILLGKANWKENQFIYRSFVRLSTDRSIDDARFLVHLCQEKSCHGWGKPVGLGNYNAFWSALPEEKLRAEDFVSGRIQPTSDLANLVPEQRSSRHHWGIAHNDKREVRSNRFEAILRFWLESGFHVSEIQTRDDKGAEAIFYARHGDGTFETIWGGMLPNIEVNLGCGFTMWSGQSWDKRISLLLSGIWGWSATLKPWD